MCRHPNSETTSLGNGHFQGIGQIHCHAVGTELCSAVENTIMLLRNALAFDTNTICLDPPRICDVTPKILLVPLGFTAITSGINNKSAPRFCLPLLTPRGAHRLAGRQLTAAVGEGTAGDRRGAPGGIHKETVAKFL